MVNRVSHFKNEHLGGWHNLSETRAVQFGIQMLLIVGIILFLVLFLYNSLTRTRHFSPDSMNYVDVAKNISNGNGLVQSTLGYNYPFLFEFDSEVPTALTAQPPIYLMLIAFASRFSLTHADAALWISVIAYGLILVLTYLLTKRLYGNHVAYLTLGALLVFPPLRIVSRFAWSESTALAFLIASLLLLVLVHELRPKWARIASFLSGLCVGLAFATRYAFFPLFFLGFLSLILASVPRIQKLKILYLFSVAAIIPVFIVLGNNLTSSGYFLPPALPSDRGLAENIKDAVLSVAGGLLFAEDRAIRAQTVVAGLIFAGCTAALIAQRRLIPVIDYVLFRGRRYLLTLWAIAYLSVIVFQRTVSHFDIIGTRLTVPSSVILFVLLIALLATTLQSQRFGWELTYILFASLILVSIANEILLIRDSPRVDSQSRIAQSERLQWIATNTDDNDLVVGDDIMDVPFYFDGQAAVSFSPYPFTSHLTYDLLNEYADHNCHRYQNMYLILRRWNWTVQQYDYRYGQFISNISRGLLDRYPDIVQEDLLEDAIVFKIICEYNPESASYR